MMPSWKVHTIALTALALVLAIAAPALPVSAQPETPEADCVADLSDAQVAERYAFLEETLTDGRRPSRWWHWGWLSLTFGAVTLQGGLAAIVDDRETQVSMAFGVIGPFLAMMTHLNRALPGVFARERLDAMAANTPEQRLVRLREAESLLNASLARERWETGWFPFSAMAVLPTAIGGTVWLGYDYPWSALRLALTNLAGGLGRVLTYPRWASRGLADYRARFGAPLCEGDVVTLPAAREREVRLVPTVGGAALRLSF